jgi:hypothetical protein
LYENRYKRSVYDEFGIMHNKLSLDEIEALRFAEEGSVEKKVFWELQEIARQKKDVDVFFEQMKYQKKLL